MARIQAITVPKWGLTMTEGTVSQWLVEEGDTINLGDAIMDMETSKVINVVESVVAGTLRRQVAQEGDTLPVAALLGVLAEAEVAVRAELHCGGRTFGGVDRPGGVGISAVGLQCRHDLHSGRAVA